MLGLLVIMRLFGTLCHSAFDILWEFWRFHETSKTSRKLFTAAYTGV